MQPQLPSNVSMAVLGKIAEAVTDVLHRYYLISQWHRSPFDEQNKSDAFLHRCAVVLLFDI